MKIQIDIDDKLYNSLIVECEKLNVTKDKYITSCLKDFLYEDFSRLRNDFENMYRTRRKSVR